MNTKELKAKIKRFVKKHEKVIVLTTAVVGGVAVYVVGKKALKKSTKVDTSAFDSIDWAKLAEENKAKFAPNWSTGELTSICGVDGTGELELIVNEIKPADLGKVGDDILKCAGVTDQDMVSTIMYVFKPIESKT